ncbi:hypothetical protein GCM10023219_28620 [Stakelama sediminis]|uniref:Secreted protein n=1 Tax=Stakelama sediminis TaxID=463200 RepID=A0A840YXR5_9SPHN|nr:Tat pathway signal protein [Stakelama sediminis]MBB5718453.1 hypothetical protein [Stakelama sediminis]
MNRRDFLKSSALGASIAASGIVTMPGADAMPRLSPLPGNALNGHARVAGFSAHGRNWTVWDDLRSGDGMMTLVADGKALSLSKRTEPTYATAKPPYLGLKLRDIAQAGADLLAEKLLAHGDDPDEEEVRLAAPPCASDFDPREIGSRLPWTTLIGTVQAGDTMPIFPNGRDRCFRPAHVFPELRGDEIAKKRNEGLLGGWLPAIHKVIPMEDGRWYDLLVFADVEATDPLIVQTWHRTIEVKDGKPLKTSYGHSYSPYPPRRTLPDAQQFYTALLAFVSAWQTALGDMAPVTLPGQDWADMARHAFAKELIVRPGGTYPKYGAVDRDYFGPEYDGFQDIFTSSLYANLEWGRFAQARAVLDNYFSEFVFDNGMVNMRGPETGQYGLTLSLLARYLRYTGDAAILRKYRDRIAATVAVLTDLHDESLNLPKSDRGYGLIHGWSESDACLHPDPTMWWKPYYGNSAFAVRGWRDIAAVWTQIDPMGASAAKDWQARAIRLQARLIESMNANIRRDLTPPYIGPLPGTSDTFREALAGHRETEQGWAHRVYCELLQADVLPDDLANLTVDCLRQHGGTVLGVVANFSPANDTHRDLLGFITYGYAQQLLRLDRIEEYLLFLYAHRHHAHNPGSWVAAEVAGIGGDLPLFCIPAQLTIPLLVRWMLVFEDSDADRLHLGRAIPRDWLGSGKPIAIEGAPTRWGRVDFTLQANPARKSVHAEVHLSKGNVPAETHVRLRLPKEHRLRSATVNGDKARLTGKDRDTVLLRGADGPVFRIAATYT